jgi:hypothetical protein
MKTLPQSKILTQNVDLGQNNKGLLTQVKMSQIFLTSANGVSQRRALRAR